MISLKNVSFSYNKSDTLLLDGINLNIGTSSRIGIVGENGCGKSTIIKLILGIFKPNDGSVLINTEESKWLRNYIDIGYLGDPSHKPGSLGLPPDLTVAEILSFQESFFQKHEQIILDQDLIAYLELNDLLGNKIESLSTGQRKRLMVCMSFRKPLKFLIADEPFDGLDMSIKSKVDYLMRKAIKAGISLLYISHNIIEIDKYTNEVYELKNGRLVKLERKKYTVSLQSDENLTSEMKEGEILGHLERYFRKDAGLKVSITINPEH